MEEGTDVLAALKAKAAAHREDGNFPGHSSPSNVRATASRNEEESHIGTGGEGSSKDLFNEALALGQGKRQADRQEASQNGEESPKDLIGGNLALGKGQTQADGQDWTRRTEGDQPLFPGELRRPSDHDIQRSPTQAGNTASVSSSNETDGFSSSHKDRDTLPTSAKFSAERSRSESPDLRKDVEQHHTSLSTEDDQIEARETVRSANEPPGREAPDETGAGTAIPITENQASHPGPTPPYNIRRTTASPSATNSRHWRATAGIRGHKWTIVEHETPVQDTIREDLQRLLDENPMLRGCCETRLQRLFAIGWSEVHIRSYEFHVSLKVNKQGLRDAKAWLRHNLDLNIYQGSLNVSTPSSVD